MPAAGAGYRTTMSSSEQGGVLGAGSEPIVTERQDPHGTAGSEDAVDRSGVIGAPDATQRPGGPEGADQPGVEESSAQGLRGVPDPTADAADRD